MSPDDVLAANLWTWPDPLIKRDRAGRVMFVNAAFLGLYGGRIQDWQGNVVTGWPSPSEQGAQRFETRAGEGVAQSVYDWVEMPMPDGNVLAIARDVTMFVATPPPADSHPEPETTPVQETASQPAPPPSPQADSAPPAPDLAPPAPAPVPQPAPQPQAVAAADTQISPAAQVETAPAPAASAEPEGNTAQPSLEPQPAPQTNTREERDFERRALPIEDSTSVLGANWRDQVIAKATGVEVEVPDHSPAPSEAVQDDASESAGAKVASGLTILLAEDNAINALLTRTLLEAEGAVVDTVEDGALALQAVKEKSYDLIFMDMRMPNMDGLESTRKIRAYGATLPIIALTANAFDDDRNACFDSGMNDFMTKPVSAEELIDMVTEWTKKDKAA